MIKISLLILLVLTVNSFSPLIEKCLDSAKVLESGVVKSLENRDALLIIDDLERLF